MVSKTHLNKLQFLTSFGFLDTQHTQQYIFESCGSTMEAAECEHFGTKLSDNINQMITTR